MTEWTNVPPSGGKRGESFYWFYGKLFETSEKDELAIVEVWKISNGVAYVSKGTFVKPKGKWMEIEVPTLPCPERSGPDAN